MIGHRAQAPARYWHTTGTIRKVGRTSASTSTGNTVGRHRPALVRCAADIRRGSAYLQAMAGSPSKRGTLVKTALVAVPLLGILFVAGWFVVQAWVSITGPCWWSAAV